MIKATEIQSADSYSIMADEATYSSNVTQLVLCIRWGDGNLVPHEEFIGLHYMNATNEDYIVNVIKDILLRMDFSLNKCRGQWHDDCSTIKGR